MLACSPLTIPTPLSTQKPTPQVLAVKDEGQRWEDPTIAPEYEKQGFGNRKETTDPTVPNPTFIRVDPAVSVLVAPTAFSIRSIYLPPSHQRILEPGDAVLESRLPTRNPAITCSADVHDN
ncbi:hypothetical protein GALMADRAFT_142779 [Galerina marginata CBS 339.88]|uniref:Uncharacterized protein n=1 Tax=Galerina marginata (strain CBS 339.88) TaxID=685588 RepID=A0A067SZI2_GALM3|nr:hypothetical protein GALMADRAFT_142779 [Galerina marginata CBS 339.88]